MHTESTADGEIFDKSISSEDQDTTREYMIEQPLR